MELSGQPAHRADLGNTQPRPFHAFALGLANKTRAFFYFAGLLSWRITDLGHGEVMNSCDTGDQEWGMAERLLLTPMKNRSENQ